MKKYRFRSREGIEQLINLIRRFYSIISLLSYSDETFSGYRSASVQETRYEISQQIQADINFCSFDKFLRTIKNYFVLRKVVVGYILSGFRKF